MHGIFETFGHPVRATATRPAVLRRVRRPLSVALVNNMPDSALAATERQFTRLILQAAGPFVHIGLYHIPELPRGEQARATLAERYRPVSELCHMQVDALIVTGNEPRADRLDAEPYWPQMARLIDWAADGRCSSLWSCLAAHAAVLHLDGVERRRLPAKLSGVLSPVVGPAGRAAGLPAELSVCHSRLNEAPRDMLMQKGYRLLSEAGGGAVDMFAKTFGGTFLFLQGHPEYETDSLLREYRRDVGRYLNGASASYPDMPRNYFDDATVAALKAFRELAEVRRDPSLIEQLPGMIMRANLGERMARSAAAVFSGWLSSIQEHRIAG